MKLRSPAGYINGQRECAVSRHRLGLRKAASNGCAAIAVYNAMLYAGYSPDYATISLGIEVYALRMGGLLGTHPEKMENYFKNMRIPAIKAADYSDFKRVLDAVNVGIVCYWVAKPKKSLLHFVAITNNKNGTYSVYNRYSNRKKPSVINSIDKLCTEDRFVNGFFLN